MDSNLQKRNEVLAQTVIKGLQSRNITGYYAADQKEGLSACPQPDSERKEHCDGRLYECQRDRSFVRPERRGLSFY